MTSFAFIAGLLPLLPPPEQVHTGNRTIGNAAVGGMLFGTFFGLILIPGLVLYLWNNGREGQDGEIST
jgi:HAE1 family hydrophobic/amphiphilic exporter-1